eukprot:1404413-Rhodomonas_salina.1
MGRPRELSCSSSALPRSLLSYAARNTHLRAHHHPPQYPSNSNPKISPPKPSATILGSTSALTRLQAARAVGSSMAGRRVAFP